MFNSHLYNAIRLLACMVTILALVGHYYLPKKTYSVVPSSTVVATTYSDQAQGGQSRSTWIDEEQMTWHCVRVTNPDGPTNCGLSLSWGLPAGVGKNFSGYEGFKLKLKYQGDAQRVRIFMRNYSDEYSVLDDPNSAKFNSMMIRTRDLQEEVFVRLSEFAVADWWVGEFNLPRSLSPPEFANVTVFGFDYLEDGSHQITVEKIEFVGDWLDTEKLLLMIIFVWMVVLLWEGLSRFYLLYRKSSIESEVLTELVGNYRELEKKKNEFENLSTRDSLTGVLNRHGLTQHIEKIFATPLTRVSCALLILDIDNFKRVNDRKGHDVGDLVLEEMCNVLVSNTHQNDIIGRWGGEEFILICQNTSMRNSILLGERLRRAIAGHEFYSGGKRLNITVSIGVAVASENDSFQSVFKRADKALYEAKDAGRNCVMSED